MSYLEIYFTVIVVVWGIRCIAMIITPFLSNYKINMNGVIIHTLFDFIWPIMLIFIIFCFAIAAFIIVSNIIEEVSISFIKIIKEYLDAIPKCLEKMEK